MGFYTTTSVTEKPHPETPSCGQKTASGKFFTYPIKTQHKNRHNSLITNQEKPLSTHETASGVFYYKFRHYSPELGRWPSRDPIQERGGVNLYAFVGNDPVSRWDLLGLDPKKYTYEIAKKILLNYKDVSYTTRKIGSTDIYKLLGGWLLGEHLNELKNGVPPGEKSSWYNSCAIRLSIALNRSGHDFSKVAGKEMFLGKGRHGEDAGNTNATAGKKHVLIAASKMNRYLHSKFGKPDYASRAEYLAHKKDGDIVIFASSGHTGTATGKNEQIGSAYAGDIWVARRPKKDNECESDLDWVSPPKGSSIPEIEIDDTPPSYNPFTLPGG